MTPRSLLVGPISVFATLFCILLAYLPTFRRLLALDENSEGLTHRIFVVPIFLFIVWGLRSRLALFPTRTFWPGMFAVALVGAIWLFGELALIRILTDVAAIAMVPFVVLTIFGYRWLWELSFPLSLLLFLVPIREPLVGLQVDMTAKIAHIGLLASGVPVFREGPYFELPTGTWSIAEACSGIEYLSACLMLAVLYAWTFYTSTKKRLVFIGGAFLVGISGNWLRAYLTILIAHISDNRFLRDSHGNFGWIMFATLLFSYCWFGWKFRDHSLPMDDSAQQTGDPNPTLVATTVYCRWKGLATVPATIALVSIWPLTNIALTKNVVTSRIAIAEATAAGGWVKVEKPSVDWQPTLINPTVERIQVFEKEGQQVILFIGIFANQTWTSKLVTSVNHFIPADSDRWSQVSHGTANATYLGKPLQVKTGMIVGAGRRILARRWYWVHGQVTSSDMQAKIYQVQARFASLADSSAWITVYASADLSSDLAEASLSAFTREMGAAVEFALNQTIPG